MTTYMEKALIDICKAAKSDSILLLKSTAKSYRLKTKTVVLKLICNGENVISFAQSNGAEKTAAKLQRSLEDVSITDIASLTKLKVTF